MRVWKMSLRRTKSTIMSWDGSFCHSSHFHSVAFFNTNKLWADTDIRNEPPHDKTKNVVSRPAKTQISLGICPVWSESSLSAWRKLGSLATHWAHSEDSDQTNAQADLSLRWAHTHFVGFVMRRLISYIFKYQHNRHLRFSRTLLRHSKRKFASKASQKDAPLPTMWHILLVVFSQDSPGKFLHLCLPIFVFGSYWASSPQPQVFCLVPFLINFFTIWCRKWDMECIVVQIGHDVDGNFNIHIGAFSGYFIARNRWTDNFVLM